MTILILLAVRRWQLFFGHTTGPIRHVLCIFFFFQLLQSSFEEFRLFVFHESFRFRVDEMFPRFEAVELSEHRIGVSIVLEN